MLRTAQVGVAPANPDEVAVGTLVTIAFFGDPGDTDTFLLGSREILGQIASPKNDFRPVHGNPCSPCTGTG